MASYSAQACEVHVQFGKTGSYVEIEQITGDLQVPDTTRQPIDTTAYGDDDETSIPGAVRGHSECSFTMNYDSADSDHTGLRTSLNSGNVDSVRCRVPNGASSYEVHTFDAFVSSIAPQTARDGAVMWAVTYRPTGGITVS